MTDSLTLQDATLEDIGDELKRRCTSGSLHGFVLVTSRDAYLDDGSTPGDEQFVSSLRFYGGFTAVGLADYAHRRVMDIFMPEEDGE